ncbi:DsbA family protein [Flavobacterium sp. FPG59]|uniref:DsbA family oxidoreductase n=1 Tax=Flavobacterium sp. FPG59 TaxID=1929267 RepID=UPI000A395679|nr:DsbA family oxidoreductase [Flavobacterium sp. FPG59]OUD37092.1 disulfide bond formation protein DsbA [Flavobacterium sp. FPG59]
MENKLKIQIWSDIMCPFCYIGKRRIEGALQNFKYKDAVEIEWKSFQLDPNFVASPNDNLVEHLAEKYRKDEVWAQDMLDSMTQNAKNSGLDFHFEKAIMANSQHAHRLLHLAKKFNCADDLKELLFKAYLTDGLDINEFTVLKNIALQVGLNVEEIDEVLHSNTFADEVQKNMLEAQNIGVQGVPFFVFDAKYAISGAQHEETFLNTLNKVWEEGSFDSNVILLKTTDGDSCGVDGCD